MASLEQDDWVARVLGVSLSPSPLFDPSVLRERLQAISVDMKLHGLESQISTAWRTATDAVETGAENAPELVDQLEDRVAEASRQKRMADVLETASKATVNASVSVVAFAKMRLKLQAARTSYELARANLHTACATLVTTPDFVTDPRSTSPGTLSAIATIADTVPDIASLTNDVDDAIDAMREASDPGVRQKSRDTALKALATYRSEIEAVPLLARMQNTAGGAYPIRDALVSALGELETALSA